MPVASYISIVTFFSFILPSLVVVLAQMTGPTTSPTTMDAWSVLGAMLASAIVAFREGAPGTGSPWRGRVIATLIASAFVGSVGPGVVVYVLLPLFYPAIVAPFAAMTWHGWSIGGFVMGIMGWGFVRGLLAVSKRLPGKIEDTADRYLPGAMRDPRSDREP